MPATRRKATSSAAPRGLDKRPFDVDTVMLRLRKAVAPHTPAAMFQLAEEGFDSVFEILVSCMISIRTLEHTTLAASRKLFGVARTPAEVAKLSAQQIDDLIRASTFHGAKAPQIKAIAQRAVNEFDGKLPCDFDVLTSFAGIGPKCANLVLGIACDQPHGVPVDIHVHRVTNRWGYVSATTPEKTMVQLEQKLPRKYWVEINKLLVPFGKFICTGVKPKCSTCPLLEFCRQVGVTEHR